MLKSSLVCFLATIRPICGATMRPQQGQNKGKNKGKKEKENERENDKMGANDFCFLNDITKCAQSKVVLVFILP